MAFKNFGRKRLHTHNYTQTRAKNTSISDGIKANQQNRRNQHLMENLFVANATIIVNNARIMNAGAKSSI